MPTFISSWGKSSDEILAAAAGYAATSAVSVRITVREFLRLCDSNGHVVRELPGQICGFLRSHPECRYAEVLHTQHGADAAVIGVFGSERALNAVVAELFESGFDLGHFTLACPPLDIVQGSLGHVVGL